MPHFQICEKMSGSLLTIQPGLGHLFQPTLPPAPLFHFSPSPVVCRPPPRRSYRPDALMARVAAEWPSSREWMKTSVIFSPPMKVSCRGEKRGDVVVRRPSPCQATLAPLTPFDRKQVSLGKSFHIFKRHLLTTALGNTRL